VARFEADGPFDLVLVDLYLPGFSGLEVCRRVRRARPEQPILVASAVVAPEMRESLEALGLSEVVTKPYLPEVLLNQVRRLTAPARTPRLPGPPPLPAAGRRSGPPPRSGASHARIGRRDH
jgi:CheY-like chemotaxis protein